jgi:hypothetical protein
MNNTVSQSHFSKMCGVSREAIRKAANAGTIILDDKKRVDLDHRITCEYFYGKTKKRLRPSMADEPIKKLVKKNPAQNPKPEAQPAEPQEITVLPPETGQDDSWSLPSGVKSIEDIDAEMLHRLPHDFIKKMKDYELALNNKTKREEMRGLLIKRDLVRKIFNQLYTIDNNQLKTLEDRIVPEICGIFGFVDGCPESVKSRKLVNDEVVKTLRFIKRKMNDFLVGQKELEI